MKSLFLISNIIIITMLLFVPLATQSQTLQEAGTLLEQTGEKAYGKKQAAPLPELVGRYIRIFLSLLGIIFAILMVYGGYLWMTSYGREERVTKAKDLITDAAIGLVITLAAYAITSFVVAQLVKKTIT